ncbi:MAG TPA: arginine deiminase family protein [Thermotogota bacterium]|nr:arginine deiminase family protein [Thermotogota bacterium]HPJ89421.1 arginine deiminase family protein [Thermotogota bacterium]HPR96565.1 arginine deiminase family protein [Thermotogota bacterium]
MKSDTGRKTKMVVEVNSEVGVLEGVILHTPGPEVEKMTPENAERALYSDILNLSVARQEYAELEGVLNKITTTFQVKELLEDTLKDEGVKRDLVEEICEAENASEYLRYLLSLSEADLAEQLIEGVPIQRKSLTDYLSPERFALRPLHNFFFTRDASVSFGNNVLINKMATPVRARESLIMETIFNHSSMVYGDTINPARKRHLPTSLKSEGGDLLIASENILLFGMGARSNTLGIDFLIEHIKHTGESKHIIIQELPLTPESFIHLDMVFTLLDIDKCMVYEPVILKQNNLKTLHIDISNGQVKIWEEDNLIDSLRRLGMEVEPVFCGDNKDEWVQEREQWHSGANFFAFAPGKLIGYERNTSTISALNNAGFEVLEAGDVISGKKNVEEYRRCVVTMEGSELARGGGGCRCMTMPVRRKPVDWPNN